MFLIYQLDNTVFAGAGDYDDATRSRLDGQGLWYADGARITRQAVSLRNFASLGGYRATDAPCCC